MLIFYHTDSATTEIYTLSLHDALPIFDRLEHHRAPECAELNPRRQRRQCRAEDRKSTRLLQSRGHLVCRLLLEKKKKTTQYTQLTHSPVLHSIRVSYCMHLATFY